MKILAVKTHIRAGEEVWGQGIGDPAPGSGPGSDRVSGHVCHGALLQRIHRTDHHHWSHHYSGGCYEDDGKDRLGRKI